MKPKVQPIESRETDDLAMMSDPRRWPRWPWLPMKRVNKGIYEFAVLHADAYPDRPAFLYTIDVSDPGTPRTYFPTADMPKTKEYPTFEHMLIDGWMVD